LGHSRRHCHVRLLDRYRQYPTLPSESWGADLDRLGRQDKSDDVARGRRGWQVFVCTLIWMALQRHRMKWPGAARTEKAFKINVPSAIVRSIASCCACLAGCPAMIAWEAAAEPTERRQGSRCARPAPPLAALTALRWPGSFASMRSWPALRDHAHAAEKVRVRRAAA
jgi:hypothetical protein